MKKNIYLLILITAFLFLPLSSNAQNLLTNGSFETGNFAGWTATSSQSSNYCTNWTVRTTLSCNGTAAIPQNGSFVAGNGFDGSGGAFRLYQDVTLPAQSSIPLTFTYRINWNIPSAANQARRFEVNIHDTSDNLLQNVYTFIATSGISNQTTGWVTETVYLNVFYGQTVRISFNEIIPQGFTGPGQFAIDNIILQSFGPTASEVGVGGNVQGANGYGIGNAFVSFTDARGDLRSTRTNNFGYFSFDDVEVGNTYVFEVQHREYQFEDNPRVIFLESARKDIIFTSSNSLKSRK